MSEKAGDAHEHAGRVRDMFATIAGRYDLLNHLLSVNVDKRWRHYVADEVRKRLPLGAENHILDLACGTGDLAQKLFETTGSRVTGSDFCRPMLSIASRKADSRINFVEGDALKLPFTDRSFDAVTIGFGLRNFASVTEGLEQVTRVLKEGGWLAVLEFSRPTNPVLRPVFGFYFTRILPLLGGVISGSKSAYTYLPNSVRSFPDQQTLAGMMKQAGLEEVSYRNLSGGIAALHLGRKPRRI